jgi:hypothetical protein
MDVKQKLKPYFNKYVLTGLALGAGISLLGNEIHKDSQLETALKESFIKITNKYPDAKGITISHKGATITGPIQRGTAEDNADVKCLRGDLKTTEGHDNLSLLEPLQRPAYEWTVVRYADAKPHTGCVVR